MNDIHQPHDKFFKQIIANKENVKSLIEFTLDKSLLAHIDLNSITPIDTQRISKKYKQLYMDAAFHVKLKDQDAQVYFLIEHKSESQKFTPLQILSYMLAVWDYDEKNNKDFEPIIPIVFYHGQQSWNNPKQFSDYFKNKELFKTYIPDFAYILSDTSQISDETILNAIDNIEFKAGLYLLKHVFDENINHVKRTLNLVKDLDSNRFLFIVDYIIHLPRYDEKEIEQILEETLGGEKVAPLVDKWINQGRQEGILEGMEKGLEKGIEKGMEKGLEKGIEKGMITDAQELLLDAIETKFGEVPKDLKIMIQNIKEREKLRNIFKATFKTESLDEIRGMF